MQSALGEGNREGDDSYATLEDRDKETDVLGVSLQMLETAADFLLGPRERFPEYGEWLAIEKAEKEQHWKRVKELEGHPKWLLLFALEKLIGKKAADVPRARPPVPPRLG